MPRECFLVTGALGCVGAWAVAQLVGEGVPVVGLDSATDPYRLRYLLDDRAMAHVDLVDHDILDPGFLTELMRSREVTAVIHLAALQIPLARARPFEAAQINVAGTVAVFEAARAAASVTGPIAYASSIAAYGAPDVDHPSSGTAAPTGVPTTHYGVYKRANEDGARVHWMEFDTPSIGLRPHVVYGVGRDQGLTSAITNAMRAAAIGEAATIPFDGSMQLHFAQDVAAQFIAATRSGFVGAEVFNLGGPSTTVSEVVDTIETVSPTSTGTVAMGVEPLPFPGAVSAGYLDTVIGDVARTPLLTGVADTVDRFRTLNGSGRLRRAGEAAPKVDMGAGVNLPEST